MKQNKQNRDCKIVQDLLPNYIENLTNEVTNEYIEEHIAKCPECTRVLKDMNGEIKLEQVNQDKEIKYLKTIHKRVTRTIALVSLAVVIIATCIIGYVYNKSKIKVNNYTFMKASYVLENEKETKDGKVYGTLIAVLDEKGVCISTRIVEDGYIEQYINEKYNIINEDVEDNFTNIQIINEGIHYNTNIFNGFKKDEVKQYWKEHYNMEIIEEI